MPESSESAIRTAEKVTEVFLSAERKVHPKDTWGLRRDIIEEIATIIDRETTNKWIPCSERMPTIKAGEDTKTISEEAKRAAKKICELAVESYRQAWKAQAMIHEIEPELYATIIDRETTNKWIPCSEEMPRLYAEVDAAVAGEAYTYRVQYRPSPHNEEGTCWLEFGSNCKFEIEHFTHWSPLRIPPEKP